MAGESRKFTVQELIDSGVITAHKDGNYGSFYPRVEEFGTTGIPFLTAKSLREGFVDITNAPRLGEERANKLPFGFVEPGDVLLSHNATIGRVAIVPSFKGRLLVGTSLTYFRLNSEKLLPRYLAIYFAGSEFQNQLNAVMSHSTRNQVPVTAQRKLYIDVPSIAEQRAIAHILGTLDDKIELNRRMNATLESMARALFQSWFVDFDPVRAKMDGRKPAGMDAETAALFPDSFEESELGLIPRGWTLMKLGEHIDFLTGFPFESDEFRLAPPGIRLARGMNVKEGEFYWDSQSRYWPKQSQELSLYSLRAGDVLIGMDGSKVGKNWVRVRDSDLPCYLVQRVARLRKRNTVGPAYLSIVIGSDLFRSYVERVKTGTSIPHISGGQIKSFEILSPRLDAAKLFACFESRCEPLLNKIDVNAGESRTLATLRDTLLPKLLSGELSVKHAEKLVGEAT